MDILKIHNELLDFLWERKQVDPDLVFRLRKTNRGNKLSDGFWFLGNDEYIALGFWKGMNWRTKMPNICFMINFDSRGSYLFINTSDSETKTDFIKQRLEKTLNLNSVNHVFSKTYDDLGWKEALESFLYYDYIEIDNEIKNYIRGQHQPEKLPFGIIEEDEFKLDFKKVLDYKLEKGLLAKKVLQINPSRLKSFEIFNFGPIKEVSLFNIPERTQWIFLTGENGVGKSSILKALATAIGHRKMTPQESKENKGFKTRLEIMGKGGATIFYSRRNNEGSKKIKPLTQGFAAYGPMRLQPIHYGLSKSQIKKAKGKTGRFNSLFENDGFLLNIRNQFESWRQSGVEIKNRQVEIKELLLHAMPNIGKVEMDYTDDKSPLTLFYEIDEEGNLLDPVGYDKLSSGYLSIAAMMSDLLTRLFNQQPKVKDIADLTGVVIIDEIDIHLHPKFQKHLVEQFSDAFPNVQFVVSTHSPIPLLGAPSNTVFLSVRRNKRHGVQVERLKKLENEINYLLPNSILSSDIFDFDLLEDAPEKELDKIYFEDNYPEILKNKEVDKRLRALNKEIFPDDLFNEKGGDGF